MDADRSALYYIGMALTQRGNFLQRHSASRRVAMMEVNALQHSFGVHQDILISLFQGSML